MGSTDLSMKLASISVVSSGLAHEILHRFHHSIPVEGEMSTVTLSIAALSGFGVVLNHIAHQHAEGEL